MPQELYAAYNSLSAAWKKEVYDYVMFLYDRGKKRQLKSKKLSAFGILEKYANPSLIEKEKDAWNDIYKLSHGFCHP